jgi:Ala-tRNA(Pro) deacylase
MYPEMDVHTRLCALLEGEGAVFRVVEHAPEGRTQLIAQIRGNRLEQAVKSMVVQIRVTRKENRYCLANVPGHCRVDLDAIRAYFAASSVAMADRDKAEALTGCVTGAIPPFSFNPELQLLADPLVTENEEIVFNAGRLDRSIFMRAADYIRIARPQLTPLSQPS